MNTTCGRGSGKVTFISRRAMSRGLRVISSGQSAEQSRPIKPSATRTPCTAPTTAQSKRSPLPWGWLLLGALLTSYAILGGVVWLLMQAAEQIRGLVA